MIETKHTEPLGHEASDADVGAITKFGIGLAAMSVLVLVLMLVMLNSFKKQKARTTPAASPLMSQRIQPPGPRLQVRPERDIEHLRAVEDSVLGSYGWVMREANVIRIPIDRAIELTAQRGLPARGGDRGAKIEDRRLKIEDGGLRP